MSPDAAAGAIDREARALARYLDGAPTTGYVLECYRRLLGSAAGEPEARIDRVLRAAMASGSVAGRLADAYARRFRPTGSLRRRVTLMLAILETAPDTAVRIGAGTAGSGIGIAVRIAGALAASALALTAGIIVFGPIHLLGGSATAR